MLFELKNVEDGISANVSESPNPKHKYRLLCIDDDSGKSVAVTFSDNYDRLVQKAHEFVEGVKR